MTGKIFKSIFMTALAVIFCALVIVFSFTYNHYNERTMAELVRDGEYIDAGVSSYGTGYLDTVSIKGVRVRLLDAEGVAVYDSDADAPVPSGVAHTRELDGRYTLIIVSEESALVSVLTEMLGTALVLFVIVVLLALFVANRLSLGIVKPINEIDLDNPDESRVYEELRPMMTRLSQQRYRITRQIAELRMKEEEFSSIISDMSEGITVINSKTEILSCNAAAKRIFDIKSEVPRSILAVKDTEGFRSAVVRALGGEVGYDTIRTDDKLYSLVISPVFQDGTVSGAVILAIDDTEKDERERLRREFTSNVSHELKTPLTAISGFAELIKSGMTSDEDTVHFADNIYKEAARLLVLVGDIIQLTRLDGAEMPYDGEPVALDTLARESAARLERPAELAEVCVVCETEEVEIPGNSLIIEEIIYNLIDNAIKYNRAGGKVTVKVFYDKDEAVLSVEDNGIGIPSDKQDRVFERFFRVDKSHSRSIGGTGLGLSIVKHSAAYHNAKISLRSTEGVGTAVEVRFPLKNNYSKERQ